MKIKNILGTLMVAIILGCTVLGVAGVWGLVEEDVAWRLFLTLIVVAVGLGTSGGLIEKFFK